MRFHADPRLRRVTACHPAAMGTSPGRPVAAEDGALEVEELGEAGAGEGEHGEALVLGERGPLAGALDLDQLGRRL